MMANVEVLAPGVWYQRAFETFEEADKFVTNFNLGADMGFVARHVPFGG